jgi:hypothetical protein
MNDKISPFIYTHLYFGFGSIIQNTDERYVNGKMMTVQTIPGKSSKGEWWRG